MYLALLDPDQDKEMKLTKIKLMSFFLRKVPVTRYGLFGTQPISYLKKILLKLFKKRYFKNRKNAKHQHLL
jgi:hypothetical protein